MCGLQKNIKTMVGSNYLLTFAGNLNKSTFGWTNDERFDTYS